MRCLACFKEVPEGVEVCPRCGLFQYQVIGDTKEALAALEMMAGRHRHMFLQNFDLGVTIYTWKDQNGTVVLDQKKRLSFGTAEGLQGKTVWLKEKFARIPDVKEMTVELSVMKKGEAERRIPVRVSVPQEKQLQQLGIEMHDDLTVSLVLKNETAQNRSETVDFLQA